MKQEILHTYEIKQTMHPSDFLRMILYPRGVIKNYLKGRKSIATHVENNSKNPR